jgi:hypothetical protein
MMPTPPCSAMLCAGRWPKLLFERDTAARKGRRHGTRTHGAQGARAGKRGGGLPRALRRDVHAPAASSLAPSLLLALKNDAFRVPCSLARYAMETSAKCRYKPPTQQYPKANTPGQLFSSTTRSRRADL